MKLSETQNNIIKLKKKEHDMRKVIDNLFEMQNEVLDIVDIDISSQEKRDELSKSFEPLMAKCIYMIGHIRAKKMELIDSHLEKLFQEAERND